MWVLNCQCCLMINLIQLLASIVRQHLTSSTLTFFLSSLSDYKAAWLLHLHRPTGWKGIEGSLNQRLNHLFSSKNSLLLFYFPALSNQSLCCLLLGVSQVSSPRPKSRVSFIFVSQFLFVDHSRGVAAGWRCRDALIISKEDFWSLFSHLLFLPNIFFFKWHFNWISWIPRGRTFGVHWVPLSQFVWDFITGVVCPSGVAIPSCPIWRTHALITSCSYSDWVETAPSQSCCVRQQHMMLSPSTETD